MPGAEGGDWASAPTSVLRVLSRGMKVQEAAKCRLVCSRFASSMSLRKMRISLPRPTPQQQETLLQQLSEGSPFHNISHLHATMALPMEGDLVPLAVLLAGLPSLECISIRSELAPQLARGPPLTIPLQAHASSCSTGGTPQRKKRSGWRSRWRTSSSRSSGSGSDAGIAAPAEPPVASAARTASLGSSTTSGSSTSSGRSEPQQHTAVAALVTSHPWMSLAVSQGPKLRSLDLDLHAWPSPMQFHLLLTRLTGLSSLAARHAPVKILQALSAAPQLQQLTFIGQLDQALGTNCLRSGLLPALPGVTRLVMLCLPMCLRQQELEDIQSGSTTQLVSSSILRSCPALVDLRSDLELGPAVAGLTALTALQGAHPAALPALAAAAAVGGRQAAQQWPPPIVDAEQSAAEHLAPAAGEEVLGAAVGGEGPMPHTPAAAAAAAAAAGEDAAAAQGTDAATFPGSAGLRHLGVGVDTPCDLRALSKLTHLESLMLWPSSERAARVAEYQEGVQRRAAVAMAAAAAVAAAATAPAGVVPEEGETAPTQGVAPSTLLVECPAGGGDSSSLSSTCTSGSAGGPGAFSSSMGSSSMRSSMGDGSPASPPEGASPYAEAQPSVNLGSPISEAAHQGQASDSTTQQRKKPSRTLSARLLRQWGRATAALQRLVPQSSAWRSSGARASGDTPLARLSTPAVSAPAGQAAASSKPNGGLCELSVATRSVSLAPAVQAAAADATGTAAAAAAAAAVVVVASPDVQLMLGGGLEQRLVRLRLLGGWQLTEAQAGAVKAACPRLQELSFA